jgi:hypothetical protein
MASQSKSFDDTLPQLSGKVLYRTEIIAVKREERAPSRSGVVGSALCRWEMEEEEEAKGVEVHQCEPDTF